VPLSFINDVYDAGIENTSFQSTYCTHCRDIRDILEKNVSSGHKVKMLVDGRIGKIVAAGAFPMFTATDALGILDDLKEALDATLEFSVTFTMDLLRHNVHKSTGSIYRVQLGRSINPFIVDDTNARKMFHVIDDEATKLRALIKLHE
jgi:hypothetical protein